MEKLEETANKLKLGKAPGQKKYTPEMIKYLDEKGKTRQNTQSR